MNTENKQINENIETSLVQDERGASFIEKLVIIGLFMLVVAAGISTVATSADDKLDEQSESIEGMDTPPL